MTTTLAGTLMRSELRHPLIHQVYRGKVRDVYTLTDGRILLVASDRISAFDVVLPRGIPHKGQVLSQLSWHMLQATRPVAPNWAVASPDPNVVVGTACRTVKVEMVVRGYLAGHAWRTYASGARTLCGADMPEGMRENDRFPAPLITPSTKADVGHDEDITPEGILERGLCTPDEWEHMRRYALALFAEGTRLAAERGLLLVDTKYEFGRTTDGRIVLIDEVHTPDSSRYFHAEGYAERQARGERQKQLSKEFVREWLIAGGFMGREGQQVPPMDDAFVQSVTDRYVELFERITGRTFRPAPTGDINARVQRAVEEYLG
ncbi:MAG: phosphoribosylaminoimidazolesuccinocarboxamide synthase [Flavobacteriales bacterium]|nr:Phosphoribosylaminoimidazole-succinocarboxamide synthase [Flavobacteriales bacterium]MCC6577764.1 phosphoribosylaminoimidazolesuccinocarboxamide synthase [Flavobacteriales bacterium]NUQ15358.1 phosphoribosylaminoimidazolesuccinocarboxamide synthase [Flavobacteriales bacterium]